MPTLPLPEGFTEVDGELWSEDGVLIFERDFKLDGDTLVLRTPPHEIGGSAVSSELRWRRVG